MRRIAPHRRNRRLLTRRRRRAGSRRTRTIGTPFLRRGTRPALRPPLGTGHVLRHTPLSHRRSTSKRPEPKPHDSSRKRHPRRTSSSDMNRQPPGPARSSTSTPSGLLPTSASARGHKTDTSETTRATPRDACSRPHSARFAGKIASRDGKEGVDGSSPSGGSRERPAYAGPWSSIMQTARSRRVPDG
jgi:hypothetical protein